MLTHKGAKTIETDRLILRRVCLEDAEPMFRNWASDPEVTRFLTWPTHETVEISQWVVESWERESEREDFYVFLLLFLLLVIQKQYSARYEGERYNNVDKLDATRLLEHKH